VTGGRDLIDLDRALDELAAGGSAAAAGGAAAGEVAALAALAGELRAAIPAPRPGAAADGRAALLAAAEAADQGRGAGVGVTRRRRFARARVLAAAALLAVAVPAALAGRALPGTPLWPLRQAGQQVRLGFVGDPVQRAHLRLNTASLLLDAARDSGGYRQTGLVACREQIQAAMAQLDGRTGPQAAAERARAERLLADVDDLSRSAEDGGPDDPGGGDDDRSGPGHGEGGSGSSGGDGSGGSGSSGGSGRDGGSGGTEGSGDG
jgi:uncharacterized membrane protein YgcG